MTIEIGVFLFYAKPFLYGAQREGLGKSGLDYIADIAESIEQYTLSMKDRIAADPLSPLAVEELFPQQFLPTVASWHEEVVVENVLELSGGSRENQAIRTFTVRDQYLLDSSGAGQDEVRVLPQMRWRELLHPTTAAAFFYSTDYQAMADRLVRLSAVPAQSLQFSA